MQELENSSSTMDNQSADGVDRAERPGRKEEQSSNASPSTSLPEQALHNPLLVAYSAAEEHTTTLPPNPHTSSLIPSSHNHPFFNPYAVHPYLPPNYQATQPMPRYPQPSHSHPVTQLQPSISKTKSKARKKSANLMTNTSDESRVAKRKLTKDDYLTIINYWKENFDVYGKSNRGAFSKKASEELNRSWFAKQSDKTLVTAERLEGMFTYWLARYKEVAKKFKDSGFGLTDDDPDTLKEAAEKNMKFFWEFHSFLACRANVNPPVLLQPRADDRGTRLDVDNEYRQIDLPGSGAGELSSEDDDEGATTKSAGAHVRQLQSKKKRGRNSTGSGPSKRQRYSDGDRVAEGAKQSVERCASRGGPPLELATSAINVENRTTLSGGAPSAGARSYGRRNSDARSQGTAPDAVEGKNSASRVKMVNDMYASHVTFNEAHNENMSKTMMQLEKESGFREKEISLLQLEQQRKDREESRKEKEELRREKEERRRAEAAEREKLLSNRQMIMDEADQLRRQAAIYQSLGDKEKAIRSMDKAEALVNELHKVRSKEG